MDHFTQTCCCNHNANKSEINGTVTKTKKASKAILGTFLSFLIAVFPKCPVCWAAYMSMFGSVGLSNIPYLKWLLPVLIVLLVLHLTLILKKVKVKGYGPFFCSLTGAIIIICEKTILPVNKSILFVGMFLILTGSLWNNFSMKHSLVFKFLNFYKWRKKSSH